jgi:hypothetical protein
MSDEQGPRAKHTVATEPRHRMLLEFHRLDSFHCHSIDRHVFALIDSNNLKDIPNFFINNPNSFLISIEFEIPLQV